MRHPDQVCESVTLCSSTKESLQFSTFSYVSFLPKQFLRVFENLNRCECYRFLKLCVCIIQTEVKPLRSCIVICRMVKQTMLFKSISVQKLHPNHGTNIWLSQRVFLRFHANRTLSRDTRNTQSASFAQKA